MSLQLWQQALEFMYWIVLLYVKHAIVLFVTPLKLLGKQFINVLTKNHIKDLSGWAMAMPGMNESSPQSACGLKALVTSSCGLSERVSRTHS
jgi:hypothetical protein